MTCARKLKVPCSSPVAAYMKMWALCSNRVKQMLSIFPYSPVIREWSWKKTPIEKIFKKRLLRYVWQGSKYHQTFEYSRVLNVPGIMNIPGFVIRIMNMPGFIIWWKEVSVVASYINFWNWTFFKLVTILYFKYL